MGSHLPNHNGVLPTYGNVDLKHQIWKTKAPMEMKHFLWRLLSRSLATGTNLKRRHVINDAQCRCYCCAEETEDHLFFECPHAKKIWRASGISNRIINTSSASLEKKVGECLRSCLSRQLRHFQDLLLWILWKSRNTLTFQAKGTHRGGGGGYAKNDALEWKQIDQPDQMQRNIQSTHRRTTESQRWKRPQDGWIKCNTDGSFINTVLPSSAGWIFRDSIGVYRGSVQATGRRTCNALESELQAILMALQHSWSLGIRYIINYH